MGRAIVLRGSHRLAVPAEVQALGDFVVSHPEFIGLVADILVECKEASHLQGYVNASDSALNVHVFSNPSHRDSLIDLLDRIYRGTRAEIDNRRGRVVEYLASKAIPFVDGLRNQDRKYHARVVWADTGEPVVEQSEHNLDVGVTGSLDGDSVCEVFECKVNLANICHLAEDRLRTSDARKVNFMVLLQEELSGAGLRGETGFVVLNKSVIRYASILQSAGAESLTLRGPTELQRQFVTRSKNRAQQHRSLATLIGWIRLGPWMRG